jgi:hypothetical protein
MHRIDRYTKETHIDEDDKRKLSYIIKCKSTKYQQASERKKERKKERKNKQSLKTHSVQVSTDNKSERQMRNK